MPETFNRMITHLYDAQDGTNKEITKYNNSTISRIVHDGIIYDFGKLYQNKTILGNSTIESLKQPIKTLRFIGANTTAADISVQPQIEIYGLNLLYFHSDLEITINSYSNSLGSDVVSKFKNLLKNIKASGGTIYYEIKADKETPQGQTAPVGQIRLRTSNSNVINLTSGYTYDLNLKTYEEIDSITSAIIYGVNTGESTTFSDAILKISDSNDGVYEEYIGRQIIKAETLNICDETKIIQGYALNGSDGTIYSSNRYVSDYIPISGSYVSMNIGASYAFYDANKNYISGDTKSLSIFRAYAIPANAKYIRVDNLNSAIDPWMMVLGQYTVSTLPSYETYKKYSSLRTIDNGGPVSDMLEIFSNNTGTYTKHIADDGTILDNPVVTQLTQAEVHSIVGNCVFTYFKNTTILAFDDNYTKQNVQIDYWYQR